MHVSGCELSSLNEEEVRLKDRNAQALDEESKLMAELNDLNQTINSKRYRIKKVIFYLCLAN